MKKDLINLAQRAAKAAGAEILRYYHEGNFEVSTKEDNSPLTNADIAANDAIYFYLSQSGIDICSEEALLDTAKMSENDTFWLVDPLDGTKEFLARNGEFSVCIALIQKARPVFGLIYIPISSETFYTSTLFQSFNDRGMIMPQTGSNAIISGNSSHSPSVDKMCDYFESERLRCGSAIKFCRVAQGIAAVYPRFCGSSLWDIAAGDAIVTAAGGGMFSMLTNEPLKYTGQQLRNDYFIAFSKDALAHKDKFLAYARSLLEK
ncbi:3'(2'),5'-bisphosphate nucleotidase CysQ [Campylobacter sp.]|uniref:3'(2'),5'-bisphosphate nucleotidase CysQ family protein n=1 Tax=Campylobacter sp. TaxID=205 RepID=UPI002A7EB332|nr:3'(2'),5'-bisphosphate nucleotidase CysQ [Campylobacter sp.]MDY4154456.1 3'(2'),5'-bisphosphate nucleotidase CysQ [Campylobacter sp.]